ncbi:MAG: hypothetical protein OHK0053_09490 [Microscillaceae bacterium]
MRLRLPILAFGLIFFACTQEKDPTQKEPETSTEAALSSDQSPPASINHQQASLAGKDSAQKASSGIDEITKNTSAPLSPIEALLQSLEGGRKIEFAPLDLQVMREDTLIKARSGIFEISFATACLNDSLIAQEMFDYGGTNTKSYLISHNYNTNIAIKKDGRTLGQQLIKKEIFKGQLDPVFLAKSILKHPQFVRFDEEKNEAIFEFIIGIPNTDWLVIAGVNLNDQGKVRVIDIVMPEL